MLNNGILPQLFYKALPPGLCLCGKIRGVLLDFCYICVAKNEGYDFQRLATEK